MSNNKVTFSSNNSNFVMVERHTGRRTCDTAVKDTDVHDERYCDKPAQWYLENPTEDQYLPVVEYACQKHLMTAIRALLPEYPEQVVLFKKDDN